MDPRIAGRDISEGLLINTAAAVDVRPRGPSDQPHPHPRVGSSSNSDSSEALQLRQSSQEEDHFDSDRQHGQCLVPSQTGRDQDRETVQNSGSNVEILSHTLLPHFRRAHPRRDQRRGPGEQEDLGCSRLDDQSQSLQSSGPHIGSTPDRRLRDSSQQPDVSILELDTRTRSSSNRRSASVLGRLKSVDQPTLAINSTDSNKDNSRGSTGHIDNSQLAIPSLVPNNVETTGSTSNSIAGGTTVGAQTILQASTANSSITRSEAKRQRLITSGLDADAATRMVESENSKSARTNDSRFEKYRDWCSEHDYNPVTDIVTAVTKFAHHLVDTTDWKADTINKYVNAVCDAVGNDPTGIPLSLNYAIETLKKTIKASAPKSVPKSPASIPDIQQVRDILKQWDKPEKLPLEDLSFLFVMINIVFLYRRPQDIVALVDDKVTWTDTNIKLVFTYLKKWGSHVVLEYPRLIDQRYDLVNFIEELRKRKADLGVSNNKSILTTFDTKRSAPTAGTISAWIKAGLLAMGFPQEVSKPYLLLKAALTYDYDNKSQDRAKLKQLLQNRWKTARVMMQHYYLPNSAVIKAQTMLEKNQNGNQSELLH